MAQRFVNLGSNQTMSKKDFVKNTAIETQFRRKQVAKEIYFSARVYKNNKDSYWLPGKIIERIGNLMYNVLLTSGKLIHEFVEIR